MHVLRVGIKEISLSQIACEFYLGIYKNQWTIGAPYEPPSLYSSSHASHSLTQAATAGCCGGDWPTCSSGSDAGVAGGDAALTDTEGAVCCCC